MTSSPPTSSRRPTIRRAWLLFAFLAVLAATLGWFAVRDLQELVHRGERLAADYARDAIAAEQLHSLSERRAREVREYLLTGRPALLDGRHATGAEFERRVGDLEGRSADPRRQQILVEVRRAHRVNAAAIEPLFGRRASGEPVEHIALAFDAVVQSSRASLDAALDALVAHEQTQFKAQRDVVTRAEDRAILLIGIAVAATLALAVMAGVFAQQASNRTRDAELARAHAEDEILRRRAVRG